MLDVIRKGQRWVTAIFVVGIGGAMVFFIGLGGPLRGGSSRAVVQVGPHEFGIGTFERTRAQQESAYQNAQRSGGAVLTVRVLDGESVVEGLFIDDLAIEEYLRRQTQ